MNGEMGEMSLRVARVPSMMKRCRVVGCRVDGCGGKVVVIYVDIENYLSTPPHPLSSAPRSG